MENNYDDWKLQSPYKDEPNNSENDLFINDKFVEFDKEFFYCNDTALSLDIAIDIMDDIDNINHNRTNVVQLYIDVFNMYVSINDFQKMYEHFIN